MENSFYKSRISKTNRKRLQVQTLNDCIQTVSYSFTLERL